MTRRDDILRRILKRVLLVDNPALGTPCWVWQGPTSGNGYKAAPDAPKKGRGHGYGRMSLDGQTVAVHLVTWTHYHGYIPGKKQLDHLCHTRACCNPSHLELVTHKRNQRRRAQHARLLAVPGRTDAFYDPEKLTPQLASALAYTLLPP
jgi:hypothetical protein